jgi:hypothetical protein
MSVILRRLGMTTTVNGESETRVATESLGEQFTLAL